MATILTKKSDTASAVPLAADLTNAAGGAELAVNATDKRLFSKTSGGTVVELGTNPSTLVLPSGSANGVAFLNGSKVVTSGSALTFGGANLGVNCTATNFGANYRTFEVAAPQGAYILASDTTNTATCQMAAEASVGYLGMRTNHPLAFIVNNSEQMRLTSTGLGIGTSSPAYQLTVGTAGTTANSYIQIASTTTGTGNLFFGDTAGTGAGSYRGYIQYDHNVDALILASAGSERLRLDSSGNLGLGVTPSAWATSKAIQVGNRASLFSFNNATTDVANNAYFNGSDYKYIETATATFYRQNTGSHSWYTAASGTAGNSITFTQAMTLDASGNLLVGTTSGSQKLVVEGVTGEYAQRITAPSTSGTYYFEVFYASASGVGSITSNGTSTTYSTSSDYRLKNTIAPMTGALAKVALLKPCTYKWNADGSDGEGFIAHELAEVVPQCVTGAKDAVDEEGNPKYQGIDTSFLVATLTAAIQELKAEFDAYKASHP